MKLRPVTLSVPNLVAMLTLADIKANDKWMHNVPVVPGDPSKMWSVPLWTDIPKEPQ